MVVVEARQQGAAPGIQDALPGCGVEIATDVDDPTVAASDVQIGDAFDFGVDDQQGRLAVGGCGHAGASGHQSLRVRVIAAPSSATTNLQSSKSGRRILS